MTNLARSEKAQILARVRAALADHERWPRQLEAEAIAQALVIDMQEANATPGDETSIPDDRIAQAARDLVAALGNKPAPFTLPSPDLLDPPRNLHAVPPEPLCVLDHDLAELLE